MCIKYGDYQLTMALHPSETIERLMVRILAFARYADDALEFTKDLFETDEPALWQKDLTGQLINWIEVGCPDEDKVKKASARCQQVAVVAYGSNVDDWYKRSQQAEKPLKKCSGLGNCLPPPPKPFSNCVNVPCSYS